MNLRTFEKQLRQYPWWVRWHAIQGCCCCYSMNHRGRKGERNGYANVLMMQTLNYMLCIHKHVHFTCAVCDQHASNEFTAKALVIFRTQNHWLWALRATKLPAGDKVTNQKRWWMYKKCDRTKPSACVKFGQRDFSLYS